MRFNPDIDAPLFFDDDRSSRAEPFRIRNAIITVEGGIIQAANAVSPSDNVTAYASHARKERERFGEFGGNGGKKAASYSKSVKENMHHQQQYCPCVTLYPTECKDDI